MYLKTLKKTLQPRLIGFAALGFLFSISSCSKTEQKSQPETNTVETTAPATPVSTTKGLPAEEGFIESNSDKKALELADKLVDNLGGYDAWNNTRFVAWTFFGNYQIWDKKEDLYRQERNNLVAIMSVKKPLGKVFEDGVRVQDSLKTYRILGDIYMQWALNTYWLALPYKLKERGAVLKYLGEEKTRDGRAADKIRFQLDTVGVMHHNMYDLWIDKQSGLLTQWAFYATPQDKMPAFIRRWTNYQDFKGVKLALDKGSDEDTVNITHVALTDHVPKELFLSALPIDKTKIK
jgi:hypothetical protein